MSSNEYRMKVLISEDLHPELYRRLSEARHPRARSDLLRNLATMALMQTAAQPRVAQTSPRHVQRTENPALQSASKLIAATLDTPLRADGQELKALASGMSKYFA